MKKSLLTISFFLFLLPFSYLKLTGEEMLLDCKFMCPEIDWQESGILDAQGEFPACKYLVYWSYRYIDCPGLERPWCDFKIDLITCPDCNPGCFQNYTHYQLTHMMMEKVIKAYGKLKPCAQVPFGDTTYNISITLSSCWKQIPGGDPSHWQTSLEPCDETQCCRLFWKIGRDTWTGDFSDPIVYAQNGINPVCPSLECIAVCEEFPQPIPSNIGIYSDTDFGFKTSVFPNPSNDLINFKIESETKGELTIEINDVLGNVIITKNIIKNQGEIQLEFKMSSYSNGNYYYVVKQSGKQVSSGSFNIFK